MSAISQTVNSFGGRALNLLVLWFHIYIQQAPATYRISFTSRIYYIKQSKIKMHKIHRQLITCHCIFSGQTIMCYISLVAFMRSK